MKEFRCGGLKASFKEIELSTRSRVELVDITRQVEEYVREGNVKNGFCLVHSLHSTTAIITNEHEAGLLLDIAKKVQEDFPRGRGWRHDEVDSNAEAHLASSFIGSSRVFPVRNGRLVRGTWQNIFLLEMDGPRSARRTVIELLGE